MLLTSFIDLIALGVERRKITSFELFVPGLEMPADIFRMIFKIFPCIQIFGVGPLFPGNVSSELHTINDIFPNFNPALIQELALNLPSTGSWLRELANFTQLK